MISSSTEEFNHFLIPQVLGQAYAQLALHFSSASKKSSPVNWERLLYSEFGPMNLILGFLPEREAIRL